MGKKRRKCKGRNKEYKDIKLIAKALAVSELIAIFYPRDGKS